MSSRWSPGIGDPTLMGWLTVAGYLVAALLCWRATEAASRRRDRRAEQRFWLALACVLLVLGINKQLDLQSLFTQVLRDAAHAQGWYDERRTYQALFLAVVAAAATTTGLAILWRLRAQGAAVIMAAIGLQFTLAFVVVRAASFHSVDQLLAEPVLALRLNWILELSGIITIAIAAWLYSAAYALGVRLRRGWRYR